MALTQITLSHTDPSFWNFLERETKYRRPMSQENVKSYFRDINNLTPLSFVVILAPVSIFLTMEWFAIDQFTDVFKFTDVYSPGTWERALH